MTSSSVPHSRAELLSAWGRRHRKSRASELADRYEAIVRRDGHSCDLCGSGAPMEFDHIVPKPSGGTDELSNMCLAHEFCNKAKGDRDHLVARVRLAEMRASFESAGREWPPPPWDAYSFSMVWADSS